jgi:Domain of Unknown Function (DUF326)
MTRRAMLTGLGLIAVGFLVLGGNFLTADDKKADDPHAAKFEQCAKACADCLRECESCAHHCANLVASGKKDHLRTLGTCADCAEVCTAAAKVVSRHGPLTGTICESCAKACDMCAAECEKHANDEHMKRCAKACRDCATACRDMLKHVGNDGGK